MWHTSVSLIRYYCGLGQIPLFETNEGDTTADEAALDDMSTRVDNTMAAIGKALGQGANVAMRA